MSARRRIDPPRLALGVLEAAEALGVSYDSFAERVAPELRWVRLGRSKRVAVSELQRWLDENSDRVPVSELAGDGS